MKRVSVPGGSMASLMDDDYKKSLRSRNRNVAEHSLLRIGDAVQPQRTAISGGKLRLRTEKTGVDVCMPLSSNPSGCAHRFRHTFAKRYLNQGVPPDRLIGTSSQAIIL